MSFFYVDGFLLFIMWVVKGIDIELVWRDIREGIFVFCEYVLKFLGVFGIFWKVIRDVNDGNWYNSIFLICSLGYMVC